MDRLQREHVHKIGQFIFVGFVAEFSQVQAITFDLENDTRLSRLSINSHSCDGVLFVIDKTTLEKGCDRKYLREGTQMIDNFFCTHNNDSLETFSAQGVFEIFEDRCRLFKNVSVFITHKVTPRVSHSPRFSSCGRRSR